MHLLPFNRLDDKALARQQQYPDQIADALLLEHVSLSLNPRATLYRDRSLFDIANATGNHEALQSYE